MASDRFYLRRDVEGKLLILKFLPIEFVRIKFWKLLIFPMNRGSSFELLSLKTVKAAENCDPQNQF